MDLAVCLLRNDPHYRRQAFIEGLKRAGYAIATSSANLAPKHRDFLVIWNRSGPYADLADDWEKRGGSVLVCENGYFGKDAQGRQNYAIAIGAHNGHGISLPPSEERLAKLHLDFRPWRITGDHVLLCLQCGIVGPGHAQPKGWESKIVEQLTRLTARPIKVRHAGRQSPLAKDLQGAWALVTWASNEATDALISGVPVFYCARHIITEGAAISGIETIENPVPGNRRAAFQRLAAAQFSVDEITSGYPFTRLRDLP